MCVCIRVSRKYGMSCSSSGGGCISGSGDGSGSSSGSNMAFYQVVVLESGVEMELS